MTMSSTNNTLRFIPSYFRSLFCWDCRCRHCFRTACDRSFNLLRWKKKINHRFGVLFSYRSRPFGVSIIREWRVSEKVMIAMIVRYISASLRRFTFENEILTHSSIDAYFMLTAFIRSASDCDCIIFIQWNVYSATFDVRPRIDIDIKYLRLIAT